MMTPYDARHWYWGPDGNGNYFSSASLTFVPATDASYLAWASTGCQPTLYVDLPTIRGILVSYGIGKRTLTQVFASLNALTTTQKSNLFTNLLNGTTPLAATSTGPNARAMGILLIILQNMTDLSATDSSVLKLLTSAMYLQDNPSYLAKPAFDPTINVLGAAF